MSAFVAAGLFLVASHALLSAPGIRPALLRALGRPGFLLLYGGVSLAALAAFVWTYRAAPTGPWLFDPIADGGAVAFWTMPLAVFLIVGRLTTPPPAPGAPARGIYRISRHPGSVGLALWAYLHLINMGDLKRSLLFAFLLALPLAAILKNEILHRRAVRSAEAETAGSDEDQPEREETRVIPFHAILSGRQRLVWREIGWWRLAAGLAVYAGLILAHPHVIGIDPT